MFLWWPGKKLLSLAGKFWFIHCIHQTLDCQMSIYLCLYKIFLMENISISWKTLKGIWIVLCLKRKSFSKMESWSCLKNGQRRGTKWWMHCSIKFSVKMEKNCLLFWLKNQRNLLVNPVHTVPQPLSRYQCMYSVTRKRYIRWMNNSA